MRGSSLFFVRLLGQSIILIHLHQLQCFHNKNLTIKEICLKRSLTI